MEKIYREGIDIRIAFKATHPLSSTQTKEKQLFKQREKRFVPFFKRLAHKILSPLTRRIRHYFVNPLKQDLRHVHWENLKNFQELKEALKSYAQQTQPVATESITLPPTPTLQEAIIVVGAGGHAKVVIEILQAMGKKIVCCIGQSDSPDTCLGITVLKSDTHLVELHKQGYHKIFIAVGDNKIRQQLATMLLLQGFNLVNALSPQAIISPSNRLGKGIAIMAGVVINADCYIEDLAIINTGTTIDHDCHIGQAVHIAPQSGLAGQVTIKSYSFLGIGCKVIPKILIGEAATIGAGSVVITSIPDNATAVGVPAKIIK